METKEIKVSESNKERFEEKIAKIQKNYHFHNIPFSYELLSEVYEDIDTDKKNVIVQKFYMYRITYGLLLINNRYSLIGNLELNGNRNIVTFVDKDFVNKIPVGFYNQALICNHCETNRKRKSVFIVYDSVDNRIMRLGRACLKTYIPRSVESVINFIDFSEEFFKSTWEHPNRNESTVEYVRFEPYLSALETCILENGYKSYKDATFESPHTSKQAYDLLLSNSRDHVSYDYNPFLDYLRQEYKKSDFISRVFIDNVKACLDSQVLNMKFSGQLAFIFFKFLESKKDVSLNSMKNSKMSIHNKASEHQGEVGGNVDVVLNYVQTYTFDNPYAYGSLAYIHAFIDDSGNVFNYIGSLDIEGLLKLSKHFPLEDFDSLQALGYTMYKNGKNVFLKDTDLLKEKYKYRIKAVVKEHKEYKGTKQTVIKLVKVTEWLKKE